MTTFDLTASNASDAEHNVFNFPDGQPHVSLDGHKFYAGSDRRCRLNVRISSSDDLLRTLLAADVLHRGGYERIDLTIAYLLGARMDRPMHPDEKGRHPFTLQVIADAILSGGFNSIRVFDPHSDVATALLRATPILPVAQVEHCLREMPNAVVLAPDAGATKRVDAITTATRVREVQVAQAVKKRDQATGKLSDFALVSDHVVEDIADKEVLIVDDLVDGGRTFEKVGEMLRDAGAAATHLYVSHGIFSRGFNLANIDRIITTDSYRDHGTVPAHVTVLPWH